MDIDDKVRETDLYHSGIASYLLELMPDALIIIDEHQNIVHLNHQAENIFQEKASNLLHKPLDLLLPQEIVKDHRHWVQGFLQSQDRVRRLEDRSVMSARRKNGESFSFLGTIAKLDQPEGVRMAIIIREVTKYLRSEQLRQRMERALYCLSECGQAVIHAHEEKALLQVICNIAVHTGGYLFAWIGYAQEDKSVYPMASAGQDDGYLQEVFVSWSENEASGRGPTGQAIRTGQPQFIRSTSEDKVFAPWREPALKRGFRSAASLPLSLENRVLGTLNLYSQEDTFDREEKDLLSRLASNLSFGISALRTQIQRDENEALLRRNAYLLQERVKELNLFYTISRLISREDLSLEDILLQITQAIPRAWQFPDLAEARIRIQGYGDFKTNGYKESHLCLSHSIHLEGEIVGQVEVVYTQDPADEQNKPFLSDEQRIIESIAYDVEDIIRRFQLATEQRKLSEALELTADTVVITDRDGTIEYVNPAFERCTGFPREEVIGQKPNILKSGQHPQEFYENMWKIILNGEVYRDTVINRTKQGSLYYEYKTITPLYDHQGRLTHFLATGKDLTEQLRTESRLQYLASHDAITDLVNQQEFIRQLDQTIADLPDQGHYLAVVVVGLNNFKSVNELLGRSQGDQILRLLGQRLTQTTNYQVARIGDDQFSFVLQSSAPNQTGVLVESFLNELARPISMETEDIVVTATAGISCFPSDGHEGLDLVQKAEIAMSRAKGSGLQHFEFYTPDMQISSMERLRLNKALLEALEQSQFLLYFQPQVDLLTGRLSGAEALVRWQTPDGQILGPDKFIPVLEEMGRIGELGDFVLREACTAIQRIQKSGRIVPCMAINLAAPQLEDPSLVHKIKEALKATDLGPDKIELEITESLLIHQYEKVKDSLNELLDLKIGVALDDFGTGYSSLQYLSRYPFSKLKIDKTFVWNMPLRDKDFEVIKAIISLGKSLNIKVLAEGVEKEEHVKSLLELGCQYVQGYLYSPPLDEESFIAYLQS